MTTSKKVTAPAHPHLNKLLLTLVVVAAALVYTLAVTGAFAGSKFH